MLAAAFWNVSWAADGDAQGSVDSWPLQAKLKLNISKSEETEENEQEEKGEGSQSMERRSTSYVPSDCQFAL